MRNVVTWMLADNLTCPCLWVGTSLGSVIVINLNLPGLSGDQRQQQPVIVSPSGQYCPQCSKPRLVNLASESCMPHCNVGSTVLILKLSQIWL